MAGVYKQYTMTKKFPIGALWKCSNCGQENTTIGLVVTQDGYNDKGAWSQKSIDKRERYASERLEIRSDDNYDKVLTDAKERKYNGVIFGDCKCKACNHIEPWAKRDNTILVTLQKVSLFIAAIITAFMMLDAESINEGFLLALWLPFLICTIIKYALRSSRQQEIYDLEEKSCPILFDMRRK